MQNLKIRNTIKSFWDKNADENIFMFSLLGKYK